LIESIATEYLGQSKPVIFLFLALPIFLTGLRKSPNKPLETVCQPLSEPRLLEPSIYMHLMKPTLLAAVASERKISILDGVPCFFAEDCNQINWRAYFGKKSLLWASSNHRFMV
jgi:hypothetical protein